VVILALLASKKLMANFQFINLRQFLFLFIFNTLKSLLIVDISAVLKFSRSVLYIWWRYINVELIFRHSKRGNLYNVIQFTIRLYSFNHYVADRVERF